MRIIDTPLLHVYILSRWLLLDLHGKCHARYVNPPCSFHLALEPTFAQGITAVLRLMYVHIYLCSMYTVVHQQLQQHYSTGTATAVLQWYAT